MDLEGFLMSIERHLYMTRTLHCVDLSERAFGTKSAFCLWLGQTYVGKSLKSTFDKRKG